MGKMSRNKGKRGELSLMHELNDRYGFQTRRGDCFRHQADLIGLMSVHVECKVAKIINLKSWLEQSIRASEKYRDGLPIVMFKQQSTDHRGLPWLVTMRKEDYDSMGGVTPHASSRNIGIYERMEKTKAAGDVSRVDFCTDIGPVVTMYLEDWVELYKNWKLPFAE